MVVLFLAVVLDLLLGDPQRWPHPVRGMGWLIRLGERWTRDAIPSSRWAGVVTTVFVIALCGSAVFVLVTGAQALHPAAGAAISILVIYSCLGARDLADHAARVRRRLVEQDLEGARQAVGMMVSRDTGELDEGDVSRGAIESVAENLVDGAIAPLLFAALFGPVGAVVFKAVSTMDSMIGKRDERYREFGTFAARLDDLLNFIPARLGYLLIALAAPLVRLRGRSALRIGWRDRRKHDSPNSAWSEAAFAGALQIKLGGADSYAGEPKPHPVLGDGCSPAVTHLASAIHLMWASYLLAYALVAAFSLARP